jgi:hypothetical protein
MVWIFTPQFEEKKIPDSYGNQQTGVTVNIFVTFAILITSAPLALISSLE